MTHNEKLLYLTQELLSESSQYKGMAIPSDIGKQKRLLRTLMNIREPQEVEKKKETER